MGNVVGMQRAAGLLGIMSDSSKSEAMWLECPGDIYIYIYMSVDNYRQMSEEAHDCILQNASELMRTKSG
jgi:hypothetical protein